MPRTATAYSAPSGKIYVLGTGGRRGRKRWKGGIKDKWDMKRKGKGEGKGRVGKRKEEEKEKGRGKGREGSGPLHLSERGCAPAFCSVMLMLKICNPLFHMLQ